MAELHLSLEHAGARSDRPRHDWLGDLAVLLGLDDAVLLNTTDFSQKYKNLALRIGLVAEHVVDEGGSGVSVSTNCHTLVHTIGGVADDVVELVGHTTRLGDVSDGTLAVELGRNNVVHHTTGVTDLERSGLDATNRGRANDGDALLLGDMKDFSRTL